MIIPSCFPHMVNLACKAVLAAITSVEYGKETAQDYFPDGPAPRTLLKAVVRDPIAILRSLIRGVW